MHHKRLMMNVDSFAHHPIRAQNRKFSIALMQERIEEAGAWRRM